MYHCFDSFTRNVLNHAFTVSAPGVVMPAPNYIAILSAPVDGRVISLPLNEGESVQKGQVILELESLTFGNLVAEYLQNRAEERYQSTQLQRVEQLTEKKISSEADLEKAKSEYLRALGALNASYSRLRAVGVTKTEIETFTTNDKITPKLKILSPISGVIDQHMGKDKVSQNKALVIVIAAIASTGGLLFGFDTGVISGALPFLKQSFNLTSNQEEWVTTAALIGAVLGALSSGRLTDIFGRKKVILITAVIFAVGSILTGAASNPGFLAAARILLGVAIGVSSFTVPLYIAEISPTKTRGAMAVQSIASNRYSCFIGNGV